MAREPESALAVATRALARRDFSERGLRERLQRAGISPAEAEEAVAALLRAGLVNDGRFALSRAQSLAERGKGDAAIRNDLQQQGLALDEIEPALASLDPERERAERVIARHGDGPATARLLARRGFAEDAVEAAVAREV
jgi:SOS response regulatory protein OraA/RecX